MRKHGFLPALLALALAACGGGENAFQGGAGGAASSVATITLLTSSPTITSDGLIPAEISAFVRNSGNQFVNSVPVTFSASSGGLLISQATTDTNGLAKASLSSAGDPTSRTITVTALAGNVSATVAVNVTGSTLTVQGPAALTVNQVGTYRIALRDSANHPIVGRVITVASKSTNTLSVASATTDSTGDASFTLTAINGGNDTITVNGLGLVATQAVAVNANTFAFTSPAADTEVLLTPATQAVSLRWLVSGAPVVGQPVAFATTRGTLSVVTVNTDSTGTATTTVSASNAGGAVVTATAGSSTANLSLEFVASTPAVIDVQPSLFSIGPNQTSTLTAVVRDAAGNLVKNKTVTFNLVDVTGGTLSVGAAVTNSQGRAQTVYTASNTASANNGVKITASVQGFPAVTQQVGLTVARRELFLSLGTGNTVTEPNAAQYQVPYIIQVTDANGNGVAAVPVSLRVLSQRYFKGTRVAGASSWGTNYTIALGCADEDVDRDGVLDVGEDFNNNGRIEAGNIVSVSPANGVTDANGFIQAQVYYPQEYAYYLSVALSASATVSGTEYVRTSTFVLPGASTDFNDLLVAPPGMVSPFGVATSCSNPN
jgi:hypothetical protein